MTILLTLHHGSLNPCQKAHRIRLRSLPAANSTATCRSRPKPKSSSTSTTTARRSALVGPYGQNLALIERRLGVVVDSRGNHITIAGSRDGCDAARRVLETLYAQATQGHDLAQGDVEGAIRAVIAQGSLFEFDAKAAKTVVRDHQSAQAPGAGAHRGAGFLYPRAQAP